MTRILKLGRQRITLAQAQKIRTELYYHVTRGDAALILAIRPFQFGLLLRFPKWISSAVLRTKWSYPGMMASDFLDSCRWKLREWKEGA